MGDIRSYSTNPVPGYITMCTEQDMCNTGIATTGRPFCAIPAAETMTGRATVTAMPTATIKIIKIIKIMAGVAVTTNDKNRRIATLY
jgi:hypothetical protein